MVRSTYLPTMNIKTESTVPSVSEECAVQVPIGSTSLPDNSFSLGSQDLVAVLKALQVCNMHTVYTIHYTGKFSIHYRYINRLASL